MSSSAPRRRICVPHADRSEAGLLAPVLVELRRRPALEVVPWNASWASARPLEYGDVATVYAAFADFLRVQRPEIVLAAFDRWEMLACALSAHFAGVPMAHMHAGDAGSDHPDEVHRAIITRLAHVLFAVSDEARENLVRMGEDPARIHVVGTTALDGVELPPATEVAAFCGARDPDLVVYHPDPHSAEATRQDARRITRRLYDDPYPAVVVRPGRYPNWEAADTIFREHLATGGRDAARLVKYVDGFPTRELYLAALKHARRVIGNSSSFIYELPLLRSSPDYIHVGRRNAHRRPPKALITGASARIADVLERVDLGPELLRKSYATPPELEVVA